MRHKYYRNILVVSILLGLITMVGALNCGTSLKNSTLASSGGAIRSVVTVGALAANQNSQIAAGMYGPQKVYISGTKMFITDSGNNRVLIYNTIPSTTVAGVPDLVLGQPNVSDNRAGLAANALNVPTGVCVSGTRLFVGDYTNNRVLVWNTIPTKTGQAADLVIGQATMNVNTAAAGAAPITNSRDLTCDATNLYVIESTKIHVFALSGLTANNPTPTFTFVHSITGPTSIAVDSTRLLAAGTSGVINVYALSSLSSAGTVAGTLTLSSATSIYGLNSDGTRIWIANTASNRVLSYAGYATTTITVGTNTGYTIGQSSTTGSTAATTLAGLSGPYGVYSTGSRLYVADAGNNRVLSYAIPSPFTSSAAVGPAADLVMGQGSSAVVGVANTPIGASLTWAPHGVFSDGQRLIVTDTPNSRVLIWNSIPTTDATPADLVLGQGGLFTTRTVGSNASAGTGNYFNGPTSVYSDGTRLFITDRYNKRVLVWSTFPTSSTQAPTFAIGEPDLTTVSGGTSSVLLNDPTDVSGDKTNLYVTDFGSKRVMVYNLSTLLSNATSGQAATFALGTTSVASAGVGGARATTLGASATRSDGTHLFVADYDNNRILIWNTLPTASGTAADLVLGQPNFTQSASNSDAAGTQASGPSPFGMSIPWSLATNGTQLYVSDSGNNRILVWNSIPTVNQQPADAVIGQTSLYTSGRYVSPGSGSVLSYPIHINLLGSTLSIADYLNSRVLLVPQ